MKKIKLTSREAILEAAFQLFNKHPRASLADIATYAGVGRATLHRHFKSRETLMVTLAQTANDELRIAVEEAIVSAKSHSDVLRLSLMAIIPLANRQWFLANEPVWQDPAILQDWEADRRELHNSIEAAKSEGVFDKNIPTPWIAETYDNLIYTAWTMVREGHTTNNQAADLAWQTLTRGLGTTK